MIYISLTTVPNRLDQWDLIKENLNSLLFQNTDKEYKVIFSIPENYEISYELLNFVDNNPKLNINRKNSDCGSILKIIGALEYATEPDDIIIALDDDWVYHEDMLEYHIKKLNEYPNHAICFKGEEGLDKRTWCENGEKKYVFRVWPILWPTDKDRYLMVPYHDYSVSYKRKYFQEDFNEEIWKLSSSDDLVMAYYLKKHEIWPLCVKWDKETDFRPGFHRIVFPIVKRIPYSSSNENKISYRRNGSLIYHTAPEMIKDFLYNFNSKEGKASVIYIEKS